MRDFQGVFRSRLRRFGKPQPPTAPQHVPISYEFAGKLSSTLASNPLVADPVKLKLRSPPGFHVPGSDRLLHFDHHRLNGGRVIAFVDEAHAPEDPVRPEPRFRCDARSGLAAFATAFDQQVGVSRTCVGGLFDRIAVHVFHGPTVSLPPARSGSGHRTRSQAKRTL